MPLLAVEEIDCQKLAACSRRRELHEQVHDFFVKKLVQRAAALSKKKHIWPTAEQRLISMRELIEGALDRLDCAWLYLVLSASTWTPIVFATPLRKS